MARKFYIIGHNPNTAARAIQCLRQGANAIEPDIRYLPEYKEKFFVYDLATENPKNHTFKDYLTDLAEALNKEKLNLALLAFDLKPSYSRHMESDSELYMKEFFRQLDEYFFNNHPLIPVLLTVGDPSGKQLLATAKPFLKPNQAIGVDEGDTPRSVSDYFSKLQMPCAYANGTSSPIASTGKYVNIIKDAVILKEQTNELKMVYAWTVNSNKMMRTFLDLGVDGIITDKVNKIRNIVDTDYAGKFELASAAHNPFG